MSAVDLKNFVYHNDMTSVSARSEGFPNVRKQPYTITERPLMLQE
jgi:hypothetical protein